MAPDTPHILNAPASRYPILEHSFATRTAFQTFPCHLFALMCFSPRAHVIKASWSLMRYRTRLPVLSFSTPTAPRSILETLAGPFRTRRLRRLSHRISQICWALNQRGFSASALPMYTRGVYLRLLCLALLIIQPPRFFQRLVIHTQHISYGCGNILCGPCISSSATPLRFKF